jgi:hypothetical protein
MKLRRIAVCVGLIGILSLAGAPVGAAAGGPAATTGSRTGSVLLDCNGYGQAPNPDHPSWRCPDPRPFERDARAFEDNDHYIGHDEPAIEFYSTTAGSGNSARYEMSVPTDPAAPPNGSVAGPVWNFQTHVAPWFGMVMCDSDSFPETTKICVPDSDTNNVPEVPTADHAGTAYMELQFYPPGYAPQISCDQVHWCVALTVTSLQINFDGSLRNNKCIEPQAFAFLTHSGHPIGPTGPDNSTPQTFKPTPDVLLLNRGDRITVSTYDTAGGFVASITDHTTGQTGSMTAGAANGWRHIVWDPVNFNCKGEPYTVHPMFSTAAPPYPSGQPRQWAMWTVHTYNVAMSDEIGHFEAPDEKGKAEEHPCYTKPYIEGCIGTDVDFDGYAYQPDWPDGSANHPGPQIFSSPESLVGPATWAPVSTDIRFEADLPALQPLATCDFQGNGCTNPPPGANFYPWFHLVPHDAGCAWTLSNDLPGQLSNFGGEQAAFGPVEFTDYGDGGGPVVENFASEVLSNPCP